MFFLLGFQIMEVGMSQLKQFWFREIKDEADAFSLGSTRLIVEASGAEEAREKLDEIARDWPEGRQLIGKLYGHGGKYRTRLEAERAEIYSPCATAQD